MGIKSRYSVWYRRTPKGRWYCLKDNLTMQNAYECCDLLRKNNVDAYVVVGR